MVVKTWKVSTPRVRKPGSSPARRARLLATSPAPTSTTMASAISAATRAPRRRWQALAAAAHARRLAALLEHVVERRPRGAQRRQQAEEEGGREHQPGGEGDAPAVEPDLADARQLLRVEGDQDARRPPGEEQPEGPAAGREHQRFGEELAHQAAAAGADGGAQRHLL